MPLDNVSLWQDRLGRSLMGLAFIGALFSFIWALQAVQAASPETVWMETWRLFGFLVFAGMFALLALRPRMSPGLWELAFFHKAAMGLAALLLSNAPDSVSAGGIDAILAAMILILLVYVLTRGWRSWRLEPRAG